jgi:hypothetical protein
MVATHSSDVLPPSRCIILLTICSKKTLPTLLEDVSILLSQFFIAEQLKMKIMFMQGLKNILKGSLSN